MNAITGCVLAVDKSDVFDDDVDDTAIDLAWPALSCELFDLSLESDVVG